LETEDREDFENLNSKFFSVKELVNLLGSTDIYQRSFALDILTKGLLKSSIITDDQLFGLLLNPECTLITERMLQLTQTQ